MATIDVSATDAARRIALQMLQERGRDCWQPRRIRQDRRSHSLRVAMQPIKLFHNEADDELALQDINRCLDAAAGSPERQPFEVLTVLVEDYEAKHYPISPGRLPADVLIRSTGEGRSLVVPRAKRVKARVAM